MAAGALSEGLVEAGAKLLAALDDAGLQPQGAAWIFDHGLGDWRYVVATSLVETMGRSSVYKELLMIMKKLDMPQDLTVQDIHLVAPGEPLFKTISGALHQKVHKTQLFGSGEDPIRAPAPASSTSGAQEAGISPAD